MKVSPSVSMPSQPMSIDPIQNSKPKGNKQSDGKKKGRGRKKGKDGKGNASKPSNDVRRGRKESKKKEKFP